MLNKPKFLSPSINMYGNTVIDLNSETLPFSCIVDGNEAITDWQIVISRLEDNTIVFDTGLQTLEKPFFPINNRNQNVIFSIDLKKYFTETARVCYVAAETTYYPEKVYYSLVNGEYVIYQYNESTWDTDCKTLYYTNFVNSANAYYWAITFKNSNSGTEIYSAAEVFYTNSVPETIIYYSYSEDYDDLIENFPKAELTYDSSKIYFSINDGNFVKYEYNDETWNEDYKLLYYIDYSGLRKRKIYFKSTYNQAEGVSLKRYGWRLTDTTNNFVIMDTISQNQIYGIADDISCVCNGLTNETNYQLELYIETQNGYFDVLRKINFDVNYNIKNLDADFEVVALNNTAGIMLNWGNLRTTEGVVVGNAVNYTENYPVQSTSSIDIPENSSVVFSSNSSDKDLELDESSYVVLSFQFNKTQNNTLFEMEGTDEFSNNITRKLEYIIADNALMYTVTKGGAIATCKKVLSDTISELCWCIVTLYPLVDNEVDFKFVETIAVGGLFPDDDLYPSGDVDDLVYPYFGEWDKIRDKVVN